MTTKLDEVARDLEVGDKAMLIREVDKILADRERMRGALQAAEKTYAALERQWKYLEAALRAKGWPSDWLAHEIAKAEKIRAALK